MIFFLLQTNLFLREQWRSILSNIVSSNLGQIGKGTFNLNESRWDMYLMSKMSKVMGVVRFKMQDSLRNLVLNSLLSLSHLVMDACHGVLNCPRDLVWGKDLLTSPYK